MKSADDELLPAWERHRPARGRLFPETPWVVRPQVRTSARIRLFCFHYAGGGASMFRAWGEAFPETIEVCAIQLPGRENRLRERAAAHIDPLVEYLTQVMEPFLDIPFACYGHSIGALCAFELTRRLRRREWPLPRHLFVAAHRAPQLSRSGPMLHMMQDADLVRELRRLGGTPDAVLQHPELMALLMPTLRADLALTETYEYTAEPALDCPITALGGFDDREVDRYQLEAWRVHTSRSFRLAMFDGDHFFLQGARNEVRQLIRESLNL